VLDLKGPNREEPIAAPPGIAARFPMSRLSDKDEAASFHTIETRDGVIASAAGGGPPAALDQIQLRAREGS
jgi:hypothetical protein